MEGSGFPPFAAGCQASEEGKRCEEEEIDFMKEVQILRKAMKGLGTDEDTLIKVTSRCSSHQRQTLNATYKQAFGRDLVEDLKSETGGNFENLLVALYQVPVEFEARCLHEAIKGLGTDDETLYEVITARYYRRDLHLLIDAYQNLYGKSLEEAIVGDCSGHFKKFMVALINNYRENEDYEDDRDLSMELAKKLLRAGELQLGTDESEFLRIICTTRNNNQLKETFEEYEKIAGKDFRDAVRAEFSGNIRDALLAFCTEIIEGGLAYHAELLHKSVSGICTDNKKIIRIIASREEIDLVNIMRVYTQVYDTSLVDDVTKETDGDYKKLLFAILNKRDV